MDLNFSDHGKDIDQESFGKYFGVGPDDEPAPICPIGLIEEGKKYRFEIRILSTGVFSREYATAKTSQYTIDDNEAAGNNGEEIDKHKSKYYNSFSMGWLFS